MPQTGAEWFQGKAFGWIWEKLAVYGLIVNHLNWLMGVN